MSLTRHETNTRFDNMQLNCRRDRRHHRYITSTRGRHELSASCAAKASQDSDGARLLATLVSKQATIPDLTLTRIQSNKPSRSTLKIASSSNGAGTLTFFPPSYTVPL